jgi:hypothetical protein
MLQPASLPAPDTIRRAIRLNQAFGRVIAALGIAGKETPADAGMVEWRPGGIFGFEPQLAVAAFRAGIDCGPGCDSTLQRCQTLFECIDPSWRGLHFLPALHAIEGIQYVA